MESKEELRRYIREVKKQYTASEKREMSLSVWDAVEKDPHFIAACRVLVYWSMADEVFTHDFIHNWHRQKKILLPCVQGDELEIRFFDGDDKLCPGQSFGILEPEGEPCRNLDTIDVVIVPGVAFDRAGNRLGRGKGYYDKILEGIAGYKIGVCFDFQLVAHVPTDELDIRMDRVIASEK